jgi:hypothetical protein
METKTTVSEPVTLPAKQSRKGWWVVGIVAAVTAALVLVGGVVVAGRLSAPSQEGRGEGFLGQRPNFQIAAAKELPTATPAVRGVVTQRVDHTLAVQQRNGDPGSNANTQLTDVIVSGDTTLYHDVTQIDFNGQPPSGPIQQKVEPGSLEAINPNSRVTVWGEQRGNQITAKVLVYSDLPAFRSQQ